VSRDPLCTAHCRTLTPLSSPPHTWPPASINVFIIFVPSMQENEAAVN
jgi:hypothetical protein